MMKQGLWSALALLTCSAGASASAQTHAVTVQVPPKNGSASADADIAAAMAELFKAEPLTAEQEARLPLARQVVGAMTPEGFYADIMDEMMSGMLQPLFDMVGDEGIAEEVLEQQVGLTPEEQANLSEEARAQAVSLLDPAAKERAGAVMSATTKLMRDLSREIEAPFRDGLSRAFAVRFSDAELRDVQGFFATPSGASFARQSVALYSDPQVMGAMMSVMPKVMENVPQMMEGVERATANLPKQRSYADLSAAQRQQLARLLGMSDGELRRVMTAAERERARAQEKE